MKKLLLLVIVGVGLTSCTKDEFELESNYQFEMTGRTTQNINGYYHLKINPTESPFINRALNSNKLREEFGWHPKDWYQLVDEMCELQYD